MPENAIFPNDAGAHGDWCPSRTSNPVLGARTTLGGFDSHTFPPFSYMIQYHCREGIPEYPGHYYQTGYPVSYSSPSNCLVVQIGWKRMITGWLSRINAGYTVCDAALAKILSELFRQRAGPCPRYVTSSYQ